MAERRRVGGHVGVGVGVGVWVLVMSAVGGGTGTDTFVEVGFYGEFQNFRNIGTSFRDHKGNIMEQQKRELYSMVDVMPYGGVAG